MIEEEEIGWMMVEVMVGVIEEVMVGVMVGVMVIVLTILSNLNKIYILNHVLMNKVLLIYTFYCNFYISETACNKK